MTAIQTTPEGGKRKRRKRYLSAGRLRPLRTPQREEAAAQIAAMLLLLARRHAPATDDGEVDTANPLTWRSVAWAIGLLVVEEHEPGGSRGEYIPAVVEWAVPGLVRINTAYPPVEVAGAWVHELAHHLQVWWPQPPLLVEEGRCFAYEGDRRRVQHDVAARVERRVMEG